MNVELYINKQLCDIENVKNFSIFLKRQFLNPAELNTKDAQKSYSITLPATSRNNEIFGFKTVEEVRSKFAIIYDAYLTIDGVKIFDGKFRLNEVTRNSYSGNLGIPAQKGIKDIFGNRTMIQAGTWEIPFGEFAASVKEYNNKVNAECIFPYVMYGLLPKLAEKGAYTAKDLWDDTVKLTIDDFPPSINCLQTISKIFSNEKLHISGSAFNDERLTKLYMSYKNPPNYQMEWNYGKLGVVELQGGWTNYLDKVWNIVERNVALNQKESDNNRKMYAVDLFNVTNGNVIANEDIAQGIVLQQDMKAEDGTPYRSTTCIVPFSGLYKITFAANITLDKSKPDFTVNQNRRVISPVMSNGGDTLIEDFSKRRFEVKLLRNWNDGSFEIDKMGYDRLFYKNNLDQNNKFDADNYPKHFPKPDEVVFVDPLQNPNLVCGVSFGANYDNNNPLDVDKLYCNPIAIKHGMSWSEDAQESKEAKSAVYSSGYSKWGKTGEGEIDFWDSDKFKTDLRNTQTYAKTENNYTSGYGKVEQVIWLEKNEKLTVCALSDEGFLKRFEGGSQFSEYNGWLQHSVSFKVNIEPYKITDKWLKMDAEANASTNAMDWYDPDKSDRFRSEDIDLIKFLPSEIKIDDWIENFCKAFNLVLTRLDNGDFELNVKQTHRSYSSNPVNLDSKAHIDAGRRNASLNLPSIYEIGFSVNKDEQGYVNTIERDANNNIINSDDGGGMFYTGNLDGNPINQSSSFSHNWYKSIRFAHNNQSCNFPLITDKEIWQIESPRDYAEMMQKDYTNLAQRFWYKANNIEVSGYAESKIEITLVKSEIDNLISLNYHNKPFSILSNYFTLFTNNDTCYTIVDCYLTTEEYNRLPHSLVSLNGDLYYPAEIDGYDPLNRRKATLKLIRKIL